MVLDDYPGRYFILNCDLELFEEVKKKVKSGTVHSGLIYLVPGLAIIISLKIYPLIHSLQLCFTDIVFSEGGIKQVFVGLENWIKVLEDPKLVQEKHFCRD